MTKEYKVFIEGKDFTREGLTVKHNGEVVGEITDLKYEGNGIINATIALNKPIDFIKLGPFSIGTELND